MYGGADDAVGEKIVDKSGDIVIRLTSIPLAMYLYNHRTYLTGTNRVGLPEPVRRKLVKKGDVVNYRRAPVIMCVQR